MNTVTYNWLKFKRWLSPKENPYKEMREEVRDYVNGVMKVHNPEQVTKLMIMTIREIKKRKSEKISEVSEELKELQNDYEKLDGHFPNI